MIVKIFHSRAGRQVLLGALIVACAVIAACADESPKSVPPSATTSQGDTAVAIAACPLRVLVAELSSVRDMSVILDRIEGFSGPLRFAPVLTESAWMKLPESEGEAIIQQYMLDVKIWFPVVIKPLMKCVRDPACENRTRAIAILRRWVKDNDSVSVSPYFSKGAEGLKPLLDSLP